jgi:hypothetical protein
VRGLVALVALGLLLSSYLMSGHVIPGDGHSHLARTSIMFDTLRAGELPLWSNRWYMGFPGELHYGPLYYLTAALFVGFLGGKLFFGTKVLLWLLHLAAAASAYALGMARYQERRAALLLALVYSLCGFHLDALRSDGKLPLSLVFAAAPLLFAQLDKLARPDAQRALISTHAALLCAFCFAAHAQYGAYVIVGYFFSLVVLGVRARERRWRFLRHALECCVGTAALTAWLIAPTLLESDYLNLSADAALANVLAGDFSYWAKYVLEMVTPIVERPRFRPGYLGLVAPVLAVLGLALTRLGSRGRALPYPLLLLLLGLPWPAFGQLRSDILIFFGVLLLATDGFVALAQLVRFRHLWLVVSCLVLLDSAEGLVKDEYGYHDAGPYRAADRALRQSGVPGRVLSLYSGKRTFWAGMDTVSSGVSTPLGAVPQLATRALAPTLAITTHLAEELLDRKEPMSKMSADLLRLVGVRYVILGKRQRRVEAPRFPPVLFAGRAERVPWRPGDSVSIAAADALVARDFPGDSVRAWAQRMQLDPRAPRAATLLVSDDALGALEAGEGGRFELRAFAERQREVALRFRAERPGYLRLAYAYSPFGHATLDGASVPFSRDAFGVVVMAVPAGEHRLVWSVGVSALRLWLSALAAATLAMLVTIGARARR